MGRVREPLSLLSCSSPLVRPQLADEDADPEEAEVVRDAQIVSYMDVDLSTDLNALLPLVAPLLSGHSDLAIGTRLARGSRVIRGPKRELISRGYNLLLRTLMGARFSDAQCGFKAIRRDQARALLPLTSDTGWFFDTELLVLAERAGLRIHEVPVDWIDDLDSRVDIIATALADLRGMARLGAGFARGSIQVPQLRAPGWAGGQAVRGLSLQVARFTVIGVASTIASGEAAATALPGGAEGMGRSRARRQAVEDPVLAADVAEGTAIEV